MDSSGAACYGRGPSDQPPRPVWRGMFPRGHIMSALPNCPACNAEYTYEGRIQYVCPECAHEWPKDGGNEAAADERVLTDAPGTVLQDAETVTGNQDLKRKGSSQGAKVGSKGKNRRLVGCAHDI